jgi:hypothetical protein
MDVVEFQSSEDVRAALEGLKRAVPHLPSMRDGIIIEGEVCRLTIGTLTLLQIADNQIFFSDESDIDKPIDELSLFQCFWLCAEGNIDEAVWIADKKEELEKTVKRFMRGFSKRKRARMCEQAENWIASQVSVVEQMAGQENDAGSSLPARWRTECVDVIASAYGWDEFFITWRLPLVRAMEYQEAIGLRISGEQGSDDIQDKTIELLEKQKEATNG